MSADNLSERIRLIRFSRAVGGTSVRISEIAVLLLKTSIILASVTLGGLAGFLLATLASVNTFLLIVSAMASTAVLLVLFAVIRWFGLFELPGAIAAFGYAGAVTAAVIRSTLILGRPLWLGVILAIVCVPIGLYVGVRSGDGSTV